MRLLLVLLIVGLVAVAAISFLIFIFLKPQEEWMLEVTPSDEIVIKGPVGKIAKKQLYIKCLKGEDVKVDISVNNLAHAFVKPKSLTLDEGEIKETTLIAKISKPGKQEGTLTLTYGDKKEEISVKVIGLVPQGGGEEGQERKEQEKHEQASGGVSGLEWLNFTIIANVKITGTTSGVLTDSPPTTYESYFTTTYTYFWKFYLTKQTKVSDGILYTGWVELKEVSNACTNRFYHQLTQLPDGKAEANVTINGCINRLPEGQSLDTSIEAIIDEEGRIIQLNFGYPEWYLGDIQGTQIAVVQTQLKTVSGTTTVTDDFWLTAIPVELLINTLNPKIGDKVHGIVNTNTEEYPALLGQYYLCKPDEAHPITIEGSLEIIKG